MTPDASSEGAYGKITEIPMIACPDQSIYPYASYGINYCPDYGEEDELRNNWGYDDNYSILRLAIE